MTSVIVKANVNIALIKYWGKRDETLFLPTKSSLSITLDGLGTTMTLSKSSEDSLKIDKQTITDEKAEKVLRFISLVRSLYGISDHVAIDSQSTVPVGAGLASSASAFSALAIGLNALFSLNLSPREVAMLARRGSGSACRSILGGFVLWNKGILDDGSDSDAVQLFPETWWASLRVMVVSISTKEKIVSSRQGMQETQKTSPLYAAWVASDEPLLPKMQVAIERKEFLTLGMLTEQSCFGMHATMLTTNPPLLYWLSETVEVLNSIFAARATGLPCFATIDAGPNVKILVEQQHVPALQALLHNHHYTICSLGEGAQVL